MRWFALLAIAFFPGCTAAQANPPAAVAPPAAESPAVARFDTARMAAADDAINAAIARGELPGAVLVVGRGDRTGGQVLHRKAYGNRSLKPTTQPMTAETVFDLASLSKPIGCATSVMVLIEHGEIDPARKVAEYLPEFGRNGKEAITVAQLLLHQGGLIPDNALADYRQGPAVSWEKICGLKPQTPPGSAFKYTDVGFIVLGKLVEKVSGKPLDQFAADNVFRPAGMTHAAYNPPAAWADRFAPTEQRDGKWISGEVHDPRAHLLNGVAGHAGVFASADDVARYCRMLLNGGTIDGKRVLKPETVAAMTQPRALPNGTNVRTFGFDCDTAYSSPRGERFARGTTFGHTGFTGTSMWVDPVNDCYVILLTNAVHPEGKGRTVALRRQVGTIAAEALLGPAPATQPTAASSAPASPTTQPYVGPVATGLDVLVAENFKRLHGKRVALVTNHTGLDQQGRRIIDLMLACKDVTLVKVFSPEHGLYGVLDEKVSDTVDPATGLRVYSLYGAVRKPSAEMMKDVDALVFDIQDIGARYYTYPSTMGLCMEACAESGATMVVLDRPNPLGGLFVDGPITDEKSLNFTAWFAMPVSHGMTAGELARLFNVEKNVNCKLEIVETTGWKRSMWFDETGLVWTNPSPNMRNPTQALLYLGVGQIEIANISVGRGTDQPFELLGAPWIDGRKLAAELNGQNHPGLRFTPIRFTPRSSKFEGKECQGVYIAVTDRAAVQPVKLGVALAWTINRLFGDQFELAKVNNLLKSEKTMGQIRSSALPADIWESWEKDAAAFRAIREKYLIYK